MASLLAAPGLFFRREVANRRAPDHSAVLDNDWLKSSLDRWGAGADAEVRKYTPAPSDVLKYQMAILPGEDCWRCKKRRGAIMKSTMNLIASTENHYGRQNGRKCVLAIGLVFGEMWSGSRLSALRRNHPDTCHAI